MSLLQQLFQLRGDALARPKTLGDLAAAFKALDAAAPPPVETKQEPPPSPAGANAVGPCREDPALPALNLKPSADAEPEAAVVLGSPPDPTPPSAPPAFIQVAPRPPRIAPLIAASPIPAPGSCQIHFRVTASAELDTDALIRHVASFPGVDSCQRISNDAHD